jgi:chromosome segregation ATPase
VNEYEKTIEELHADRSELQRDAVKLKSELVEAQAHAVAARMLVDNRDAEIAKLKAENERLKTFARVVRVWDDACEGKIPVRTDGARANVIRRLREIADLLGDDDDEGGGA